jgi:hypothetical protein
MITFSQSSPVTLTYENSTLWPSKIGGATMTTPRYLAALSLLDQAGIPYTSINDDAVEVDCRFILHTGSGYWREHFGIRHGYTVRELVSEIKRGTIPS